MKDCEEGQQDADDAFSCNQTGGVEQTVFDLIPALGVFHFFLVKIQANQTADHHRSGKVDRQVETNRKGKDRNADNLHDNRNEDAGKYQSPGKISVHNAFNDQLHQGSLRSRKFFSAVAPCAVEQIENAADRKGGSKDTDEFTDLLAIRGGTDNITGLQILRNIACNRGGNADDGTDGDGGNHAVRTDVAGCS